jgi:hypothetical protein
MFLQHYNLMYAYSAMASYFARDNVALLGFAKVMTYALSSSTLFTACYSTPNVCPAAKHLSSYSCTYSTRLVCQMTSVTG